MSRPQIAIASHDFGPGGGMERCNMELARALAEIADVHVVGVKVDEETAQLARRVVRLRVPPTPNLAKGRWFLDRATRQLAGFNGLTIATGATLWRSDFNVVHMCHRAWQDVGMARGFYQRFYTRCNARWERTAIRNARHVVAISKQVRNDLVRWHDLAPDAISVVTHGISTERFRPREENESRALEPAPGRLALLFVGNLGTPIKGLDTVLEALHLEPELPIELWVAGTGRRNPYPEQARQLGIAGRVRFLGHQGDVAALYRSADAFVLPSRYDAFGMVVLEAMASGLPVLISRQTGASELVRDGAEGWVLAAPHDAATLRERLQGWCRDPGLRRQMGRQARQTAMRHTVERSGAAYVELVSRWLR